MSQVIANKVVLLTAAKLSKQIFSKPRVISITMGQIKGGPIPSSTSGLTSVKVGDSAQAQPKDDIMCYEGPVEIQAQMTQDITNDLIAKQKIESGKSANGTTQGSTATITKYMTEFTTVTGGSADSCLMPTVLAYGQKNPIIIINNGAGTLNVFPGVGDKFDGGTANAAVTIAAGKRKTFVALAALNWTTCDDFTQ